MLTTTIESTIERRLLVNYRIEPDLVARQLPKPFRPLIVSDWAIGGVCFIRLGGIRPAHAPAALGMTTENAAHRFAVEWEDDTGPHVGVYVPRRHTSSRITAWLGGRVFPGDYRLARFHVIEGATELEIGVASTDGSVRLSVAARVSDELGGSLFSSTEDAVDFFRSGSISFSPTRDMDCLDGVRLVSDPWVAKPVFVERMASSVFDDVRLFPRGACTLDSGLLMRNLPARWLNEGTLGHLSLVGVG
jgi:Uncharacterized conserved protein (COG2071)